MAALYRFDFNAMGSPCELQLYANGAEAARGAAERAIADVRLLESRYSRYRDDSVIASINRCAARGEAITVDAETAALLNYAQTCHRQSAGLFDITSGLLRKAWDFKSGRLPEPSQIEALLPRIGWDKLRWEPPRLSFTVAGLELDFGGIVKEYAADRAANLCAEHGMVHGLVNLGGDIRLVGPHPDGSPWLIGIRDPNDKAGIVANIALTSGGLASSGAYERCMTVDGRRYGHILDPRSGWPVRGLAAVSVVAPSCLVAGSACTIAMLKGRLGGEWLRQLGLAHLWVDDSGQVGGDLAGPA